MYDIQFTERKSTNHVYRKLRYALQMAYRFDYQSVVILLHIRKLLPCLLCFLCVSDNQNSKG